MQGHSLTRYATLAALVAALACARNPEPDDPDQSAAARDTATDTLTAEGETPPGYRGMERDTTQAPTGQTPSDTFLQNQGQGTPQDTAGYAGMERVDTTGQGQQGQTDTTGFGGDTTGAAGGVDTSGMTGADTTGTMGGDTTNQGTGQTGVDTAGTSQPGDTTGYGDSQQSPDSTNR
jgi:hypothetical protein